jgi:hypothetical protein
MALPDLLVIGAQKAGTTSLHHYLDQHPQVQMCKVKEPSWFSWQDWAETNSGNASIRDRETYELLFEGAEELRARYQGHAAVGESSTDYLYAPLAPERVADLVPEARIVVLLRQPAERAWSNWKHARREAREPLSFEEALVAEPQRIAEGWGPMWHYAAKSTYAPQLDRWQARFRLHVALTSDLDTDPVAVCQGIFGFLGIESAFLPHCRDRYNVGSMPHGVKAEGQLHRALVALGARVPWPYRHQIRDALFPRREMDPELKQQVTEQYFAADIAATASRIDRDLSAWLP